MARVKLNQENFGLSSIMERITRAKVKDCFKDEDTIYFVVGIGELGKAIGKGGINIKKAQQEFGKKIKVIEFRNDPVSFARNLIYPLKVEEIVLEGEEVLIKDNNKKVKGQIIGRDRSNLIFINQIMKRFFNVEIKVV
ncbi:NusA-like transcription termination signal-binding factor [Candidatus Woesearchaeota archaeon]|nr:NusA-like transcription termination signal-binding factor [Candidatus Woesearchaeota archaeon]